MPDTGDLREDLLQCGRAYVQTGGRNAEVLASVISAARHDPALREASRQALGAPYGGLFDGVLSRAVERGLVRADLDLEILAQVFAAIAYQKVATQGSLVGEDDVTRVVDGILLPVLAGPRRT